MSLAVRRPTSKPLTVQERIATAILNARGGRRGAPMVSNVLEFVRPQDRQDALEDAAAVMKELGLP